MNRWKGSALVVALLCVLALALSLSADTLWAAEKGESAAWSGRNFDRRNLNAPPAENLVSPAQAQAIEALRRENPNLLVDSDRTTGGLRKIATAKGHLTGPQSGSPEQIAIRFAEQHLTALGLTADDLAGYEVTDSVISRASGVTNIYLRQRHGEIPVYNAQLHATITGDGRVTKIANQFVPNLAAVLNTTEPSISAESSIHHLSRLVGALDSATPPSLAILPIRPGEARLVWNFVAETAGRRNWYDVTVDAVDGRVWTLGDWINDDSYKVYEQPVESPLFTAPAPPADGRTVQVDPARDGSPFGWHDTNGVAGAESQLTTGNNVHACIDNASPADVCDPGSQPSGGPTLDFAPVLDLTLDPNTHAPNRDAAVVNLFYWNNIIHDIEYLYGFDEAAGNFQVNNYGNGGLGGDAVQADAQDGSGTCNANFGTPPDGQSPRMQMYLSASSCTSQSPRHDGDLDNLVIVHEYGHGISNRLVGGPANVSCLLNTERPSEGLSDWWGMSLTAIPSQTSTTIRGTGTWLFFNEFPNGIRPQPYTTDNSINDMHYERIEDPSYSVPHGVGSVWAQGYWEAYWALVDEHGFEEDLYSITETVSDAGNIRAKLYLNEGLKATACSPGFVDVRDGLITAAQNNYGGEDVCLLWEAFAAYGLGFSANQGSSGSRSDQTEAFDLPEACTFGNAGNDVRICAGSGHIQDILVGPAYTTPPVAMSVVGTPAPATATFSENPVAGELPKTITLTFGNTAAVPSGSYPIDVTGLDGGALTSTDSFLLTVDATPPAGITLSSPADDAIDVERAVELEWSASAIAGEYDVEVATDAAFTSIVASATVAAPDTTWIVTPTLLPVTEYFWRVRAGNACGEGAFSTIWSFTTEAVPPTLLVDDDDNTPDVLPQISALLNTANLQHDVWSTGSTDTNEPTAADLAPYKRVIWFSGNAFGTAGNGPAGPGAAAETALAAWLNLNTGNCFILNSQDYLWDNNITSFGTNYLGLATENDDESNTTATGRNFFASLGVQSLVYGGLYTNYNDVVTTLPGTHSAFDGSGGSSSGPGAIYKDNVTWKTALFTIALEAFPAASRQAVFDRLMMYCDALFQDGFETGNRNRWSESQP